MYFIYINGYLTIFFHLYLCNPKLWICFLYKCLSTVIFTASCIFQFLYCESSGYFVICSLSDVCQRRIGHCRSLKKTGLLRSRGSCRPHARHPSWWAHLVRGPGPRQKVEKVERDITLSGVLSAKCKPGLLHAPLGQGTERFRRTPACATIHSSTDCGTFWGQGVKMPGSSTPRVAQKGPL